MSGNNKVWKKFTFAPITTTKIKVHITATSDNWSRMVEVEAWAASPDANISWLVSDHPGTPRMIVDQTGTLANLKRYDYLPFGEELFAGRNASIGYTGGDGVRQQFTTKERDIETGLDYFSARYYSPTQGRFCFMRFAKILYNGFYDAPLAFVTSHANTQYLFWRGFFDEQLDDYPNDYRVFVLPNLSEEQINESWVSLPDKAIAYVGKVSMSLVAFDPTRREFIDTGTFDFIER